MEINVMANGNVMVNIQQLDFHAMQMNQFFRCSKYEGRTRCKK